MIPISVKNEILSIVSQEAVNRTVKYDVVAIFQNFSAVECSDECITRATYSRLREFYTNNGYDSYKDDYIDVRNEDNSFRRRGLRQEDLWKDKEIVYEHKNHRFGLTIRVVKITGKGEHDPHIDTSFENVIIKDKDIFKIKSSNVICGMYSRKGEVFYRCVATLGDRTQFDSYNNLLDVLLTNVQGSPIPYDFGEYKQLIYWFKRVTGLRITESNGKVYPIPKATNILSKELVFGGIVGNKETYTVTAKADGERYYMCFAPNGIWFIDPPMSFVRVSQQSGHYQGIVLDGEMVPKEKQTSKIFTSGIWYLAFDTVAFRSKPDVQYRPHSSRMAIASKISKGIVGNGAFMVSTKTFKSFTTANEFYEAMNSVLDYLPFTGYETDGVIFTPEFEQYQPKKGDDRSLVIAPGYRKWKPRDQQTMDLLVSWVKEDGEYFPTLLCKKGKNSVKFTGNAKYPFDSKTMVERTMIEHVRSTEVIEFGWCETIGKLILIRFRNDKIFPNQIHVCDTVWNNVFEPISEETMRGKTDIFVRNYHQRVKRDLYKVISNGSNVIDIGSGVGKDAQFWSPFAKILAVEPNKKSLDQLSMNVTKNGVQNKVQILGFKGEDSNLITDIIQDFFGGPADAMTFMFSLGHFWKTKGSLSHLCDTIHNNLAEGGELLFFGFDGYCVEQFFDPAFGGAYPANSTFKFLQNVLVFNPKKRTITMNGVEEHLIYIDELLRTYNEKYDDMFLKESWCQTADYEKLLSINELKFTRLFSFGKLKHIVRPGEEPVVTEHELDISEDEDMDYQSGSELGEDINTGSEAESYHDSDSDSGEELVEG